MWYMQGILHWEVAAIKSAVIFKHLKENKISSNRGYLAALFI